MTHREKKKKKTLRNSVCVEMPGLLENKMPSSLSLWVFERKSHNHGNDTRTHQAFLEALFPDSRSLHYSYTCYLSTSLSAIAAIRTLCSVESINKIKKKKGKFIIISTAM